MDAHKTKLFSAELSRAKVIPISTSKIRVSSPKFKIKLSLKSGMTDHEASDMELEREVLVIEEEEDPFLQFIDYAKSVLSPDKDYGDDRKGPSWSWIASRILRTCIAYSSGVTSAILLSDLLQVQNGSFHNPITISMHILE